MPATGLANARKNWTRRILREPLLQFFALGALIILLFNGASSEGAADPIVVDSNISRAIAQNYAREYGVLPGPAKLDELIDAYVEEEVLYREGIRLGIGQEDEIVRRRIIQKMRFLSEDTGIDETPTEARLRAYYRANLSNYERPASATFSHVFFAPGGDGARLRAQRALSQLEPNIVRAPELGDPFSDLYDYSELDAAALRRLFGDTPLVDAIGNARIGQWSGPYRSAYGWHLVRVAKRNPAASGAFDSVHDRLLVDYRDWQRDRANREAYDAMRGRYRIERGKGQGVNRP